MVVNILLWCLFGLIAGAVAQFIMPGKQRGETWDTKGVLITILLGIAGAIVGGLVSSNLFGWDITGFNIGSFAIAILGALLLLVLYQLARFAR
jgi:uncharacterized membrane protein YeaQ/YmgE (transglycosylase-associated protein family)